MVGGVVGGGVVGGVVVAGGTVGGVVVGGVVVGGVGGVAGGTVGGVVGGGVVGGVSGVVGGGVVGVVVGGFAVGGVAVGGVAVGGVGGCGVAASGPLPEPSGWPIGTSGAPASRVVVLPASVFFPEASGVLVTPWIGFACGSPPEQPMPEAINENAAAKAANRCWEVIRLATNASQVWT